MLSRLWQIAGGNPADAAADWNATFDSIGLILVAPPRNGGYGCTPLNSVSFANTGGDGVHYSWLVLPDRSVDFSPIVMTVPMCDTPNVIVGENLREFLCLGRRFGYFALEQLVYQPQQTVDALATDSFDPEAGAVERGLLQRLTAEFKLSPWEAPGKRLAALRDKYLPLLTLPDPADVA